MNATEREAATAAELMERIRKLKTENELLLKRIHRIKEAVFFVDPDIQGEYSLLR